MKTLTIRLNIEGVDHIDAQDLRDALSEVLAHSTAIEAIETGLFPLVSDDDLVVRAEVVS